jgi:hypothetical protein
MILKIICYHYLSSFFIAHYCWINEVPFMVFIRTKDVIYMYFYLYFMIAFIFYILKINI